MMGAPTGYAPAIDRELGETTLCKHCATLIRWWPGEGRWRHCMLGLPHPAEAMPDVSPRRAPDITESERRLLDGNR